MLQSEIASILRSVGIPVVFNKFKKPTAAPYIFFLSPGTDNMNADDRVYLKARRWRVFLISTDKDNELESQLEAALNEGGICWEIEDETPVEDAGLYQVIYEFEELEG